MSQTGKSSPRTRILEAAASLLRAESSPLQMSQVATAARVSRATLYREFADRAELIRALRRQGAHEGDRSLRSRIIEGARAAISEHGVLAVTVGLIAEAAGVGEASVYREFEGKDAVISAAFDELPVRRLLLDAVGDVDAPVRATLVEVIAGLLAFSIREPELLRVIAFAGGAERRYVRSVRRGQRSAMAAFEAYLAAQLKKGTLRGAQPMQLAGALLGAAYATSAQLQAVPSVRDATPDVLARIATDVVDLFLVGAGGPSTRSRRSDATRE
jgi:AcrR family transcriptional regulator